MLDFIDAFTVTCVSTLLLSFEPSVEGGERLGPIARRVGVKQNTIVSKNALRLSVQNPFTRRSARASGSVLADRS